MKDRIIECICEMIKAYSLESEWTSELEAKIRNISGFSERRLVDVLHEYNPKGVLYNLDVEIEYSYGMRLYYRFQENTSIRREILRRYNL